MNFIKSFPVGEEVLGVTVFNGELIVSTSKGIYVLKGNKLEPIECCDNGCRKDETTKMRYFFSRIAFYIGLHIAYVITAIQQFFGKYRKQK